MVEQALENPGTKEIALWSRPTLWAGVCIAVLITALVCLAGKDRLAGLNVDLLHWLRFTAGLEKTIPDQSPTVVVAIDESTYRDDALKGLPRVMWTPQIAAVQDAVLAAGATVFGWDIVLPTSANSYLADRRYDKPLLVSLARNGKRSGKVVLGEVSFGEESLRPFVAFQRAVGSDKNIRNLQAYFDEDGTIRAIPALLGVDEKVTSMALELAARHSDTMPEVTGDNDLLIAGHKLKLGQDGEIRLNFSGQPNAVPTFAFADLLACAASGNAAYFEEHFKGRAVLLGLVDDLNDRKVMPTRLIRPSDMGGAFDPCTPGYTYQTRGGTSSVPGVYSHATAVNNLILGNTLVFPPGPAMAIAVLAIAGMITGAALYYRLRPAVGISAAVLVVWVVIATVAFRDALVLPLTEAGLAALLCLGVSIAYRFLTTDKERALIHETFKHYLDPKVIDDMIERGETPSLGGESKELTVFFSDIASFSRISEGLGPDELVSFLNKYFVIMGEEIENHGGIIERFVGDAVLALFGAPVDDPDHAKNCVACCLAIQKRLTESQDLFNVPGDMEVVTRIGINSGVMTVGNVGAERRFGYTVIGDAVNLSARLESGNKQFGTTLVCGDRTWELCADDFEWRKIDTARVVGRNQPVVLREPLGPKGSVAKEKLDNRDIYEEALSLRQSGAFGASADMFEKLGQSGDPAAIIAAKRSREYAAMAPNEDWDGVVELVEK